VEEILRYQLGRWQTALEADEADQLIVLDGDPFKLYYTWAQLHLDLVREEEWRKRVRECRDQFARGEFGLADLILYSDPPVEELIRRKVGDPTRQRRNFERHTSMRPYFRRWYEAVARLDRLRVVWQHPSNGLSDQLVRVGRRRTRSGTELFDQLLGEVTQTIR
jgi:hypothetical protein